MKTEVIKSDTDKIRTEVNQNQKYCDDRYVSWRWAIGGIVGTILLAATMAWGLGQWGAKVDNALNDYYEFKSTCEMELKLFRKTASEGNMKLDTMIVLMKDIKKHGL